MCEFSLENCNISGQLSVDENGECTFEFLTPSELNGTIINVNQGFVNIESNGYKSEIEAENFPQNSFVLNLYSALLSLSEHNPINESGKISIIVTNDTEGYKLWFNNLGILETAYFNNTQNKILFRNIIIN